MSEDVRYLDRGVRFHARSEGECFVCRGEFFAGDLVEQMEVPQRVLAHIWCADEAAGL